MVVNILEKVGPILLVGVPGLYAVRTNDQRPLRGRWLVYVAIVVAVAPAIAWYRAAQEGFTPAAEALASAMSVPLAQLALMAVSIEAFKWVVGRPPAQLEFLGAAQQENVDTLMHGFMLFVVGIGGMFLYASLRH